MPKRVTPDLAKNNTRVASFSMLGLMAAALIFILFSAGGATPAPGSISSSPSVQPTLPASTLPPSSDITSCLFTRSDQTPTSIKFNSTLLIGYIEQAAQLSGVPAAVLGGIIRIESPSSSGLTDSTLSSIGCPESSTGALGIMQIQPSGTIGYDADAVSLGASFLGKKASDLTKSDFCSIPENITIGSGFIIQKTHTLLKDGGTGWNPSWTTNKSVIDTVAIGYYGCLRYGGPDPNKCYDDPAVAPYSYGDDLWNSIQSCQVTPSTAPNNSNSIVTWAQQIDKNLFAGTYQDHIVSLDYPADLNGMTAQISSSSYQAQIRQGQDSTINPTGVYFCTNLVIDSYNLAGVYGLGASHQAVKDMYDFWLANNALGYIYFPLPVQADQSYWSQIQPGDAMFFYSNSRGVADHVSIVYKINLNSQGSGELDTYDANSSLPEHTFPINNWQIVDIFASSDPSRDLSIIGFGGHK